MIRYLRIACAFSVFIGVFSPRAVKSIADETSSSDFTARVQSKTRPGKTPDCGPVDHSHGARVVRWAPSSRQPIKALSYRIPHLGGIIGLAAKIAVTSAAPRHPVWRTLADRAPPSLLA